MKSLRQDIVLLGGRMTKVKKAVIEVLLSKDCLHSKKDIIQKLRDRKIIPNRSTIYRILQFLTKNKIIHHNNINSTDYYEIPKNHHHHLICLSCKKIMQIRLCNELKKQEKIISSTKKFLVVNHSLEFYGYCYNCL